MWTKHSKRTRSRRCSTGMPVKFEFHHGTVHDIHSMQTLLYRLDQIPSIRLNYPSFLRGASTSERTVGFAVARSAIPCSSRANSVPGYALLIPLIIRRNAFLLSSCSMTAFIFSSKSSRELMLLYKAKITQMSSGQYVKRDTAHPVLQSIALNLRHDIGIGKREAVGEFLKD